MHKLIYKITIVTSFGITCGDTELSNYNLNKQSVKIWNMIQQNTLDKKINNKYII